VTRVKNVKTFLRRYFTPFYRMEQKFVFCENFDAGNHKVHTFYSCNIMVDERCNHNSPKHL